MQFTSAQQPAVKTWLTNNASGQSDDASAALLNANASPDFWIWRSLVPETEIYQLTTADGTTWNWTTYIGRNQAERDAWRQMVSGRNAGLVTALPNVRQAIADIFSGAGGANQRTHLLTIGRRKATVLEKLLASGTGSTAVPADMGIGSDGGYSEGHITDGQVAEIRG